MTNATNVLIIAMRPGGAVVRCRSFPNNVPDHWDDIVFFCSRNITVSDLVFEHCGQFGSGMPTEWMVFMCETVYIQVYIIGMHFIDYCIFLYKCT